MISISRRAAIIASASLLAVTGGSLGVVEAQAQTTIPTCALADLYLAVGPTTGGAGSLFQPIQFTNTSTRTCALRGYPGVSVVDVQHNQIGAAATRNPHPVSTVLVQPDRTVVATLRTNSAGVVPSCRPTAAYLRVFPPASFQSELIPDHLQVCGVFEVNPVQTGP